MNLLLIDQDPFYIQKIKKEFSPDFDVAVLDGTDISTVKDFITAKAPQALIITLYLVGLSDLFALARLGLLKGRAVIILTATTADLKSPKLLALGVAAYEKSTAKETELKARIMEILK